MLDETFSRPVPVGSTLWGSRSAGEVDVKALLSVLPAAIYTTDAEGRITFYNPAAAELWGCEPELGTSAFCGSWSLRWADGRPMRHDECPMAEALRTGRPVHGAEAVAERPDGKLVPFAAYSTPLFDAAGNLVGAVNMLVDISHRKAAEASARSQARVFQMLNTLARIISEDLDLVRIAQAVTGMAVEVSGAKLGAFVRESADGHGGVRVVQALPAGQDSEALAVLANGPLLEATLRNGEVVRCNDLRSDPRYAPVGSARALSDGGMQLASFLAVPVRRHENVLGAVLVAHPDPGMFTQEIEDVVAGIAVHAAIAVDNAMIHEDERRLAAIIATSTDAIASKDLDGVVTSWNPSAERLFGYAAAEMIGQPITVIIPPDRRDEERQILDRIRHGERVEHYETVRRRKDGSMVDISLTVSPLKDVRGRIVGASKIARDITERKQAQARQELLTHEVQHRTKNLFAVVHAVVSRSFAGKTSVEEARTAVLDRLQSLAHTHILLFEKAWQGADLGEIVRAELGPYAGRVMIEGPEIVLNNQAAQNFALALHELATNAAKYGALSSHAGQVRISWSSAGEPGSERQFLFRWEERGGPPVEVPARKGFGSTVLEQVMAEYFDIPPRIEFAPSGVVYELRGPLETIAG